jgi:hypothetical protein
MLEKVNGQDGPDQFFNTRVVLWEHAGWMGPAVVAGPIFQNSVRTAPMIAHPNVA